jgi:UDP-glucuronate 4-epimerase
MYFIGTLEKALGKEAKKKFLPMQLGDVPDTWADTDDLIEQIDYRPNTSIEQGVANFAVWFKGYHKT